MNRSGPTISGCKQYCFSASQKKKTSRRDRKSTRLNSSHVETSYAVFCLKKKKADLAKTAPEPWDSSTTYGSTRVARGLSSRVLAWLTRPASMALRELHQPPTRQEDGKRRLPGRMPLEICGSSGEKAKMQTIHRRPTEFW